MIDVPVRVKDALRSGEYKKNYRITVYGAEVINEHKYEDPEISIYEVEGPLGDYWSTSAFTVNIDNDSHHVKITIDGVVTVIEWDDNYITVANPAYADWFDIDEDNNITTITLKNTSVIQILGQHTIPAAGIQAAAEFTYVNVASCVDNVIQNDRLVAESVSFDERMCSDSEIKFGLCEGSSLEFQYFDFYFNDIRKYRIFAEIDVYYEDEHGEMMWHTIPIGWFDVHECSRQASTGITKVVAYNKLKSDYFSVDQNAAITEIINDTSGPVSVTKVLSELLEGYSIEYDESIPVNIVPVPYRNSGDDWNDLFNGYEHRILENHGPYEPPDDPTYMEAAGKYFTFFMAKFAIVPQGESGLSSTFPYGFALFLSKIWKTILQPFVYNYLLNGPYAGSFQDWYPEYTIGIDNVGDYQPVEYVQQADADIKVVGTISWDNGFLGIGPNKDTEIYDTGSYTGYFPVIEIPILITTNLMTKPDYTIDADAYFNEQIYHVQDRMVTRYRQALDLLRNTIAEAYNSDSISRTYITLNDIGTSNISLRELQTAVFEADIQFGKLDRVTDVFSGVELNSGELYPRDDLYPADTLFPQGDAEAGFPSMYSKLWADENNVRTFRNLIITYKTTVNGNEEDATLTRVVNADGTDDYIMGDNWLFRNLVWTEQRVNVFADMMVPKLQKIKWFPFEMWCAGLPYIEAGDELEIHMKHGTYKSYVLRRGMKGIQNLQDEMINGTLDIF